MQENPAGKNLPVYASLSTMRQEPSQSEMNNGVIPLDTLPAAWWNWMWNAITQAQNDSMYNDDVLFTEINNVLTAAGITPGTSAQHDQLRQAIMVIKSTIATTAAAGSVLSTDSGTTGTIKVAADGKMTVNNFGDIASFHGAAKDNLVGALNETYDIAYGNKDNAGELTTLTTTAKDTLVAAINELDDGKAPVAHASTATTYGIGNADNYGHVKLTDTPSSDSVTAGIAATPKLVQDMVRGGMGAVNAAMFTYVVDSDQKLSYWFNNVTTDGQDYTSVLVRKGTWRYTHGGAPTEILTDEYTDMVWGEAGADIHITTGNDNNDALADAGRIKLNNLYHISLTFTFRNQRASVYLTRAQDSLITINGSGYFNLFNIWRTNMYAYPYRHGDEADKQVDMPIITSCTGLYECEIHGYGFLTINPPDQPDEYWGKGGLFKISDGDTIVGCRIYAYYRADNTPERSDSVFTGCVDMHRNLCTIIGVDHATGIFGYSDCFASRMRDLAYHADNNPEGGFNATESR